MRVDSKRLRIAAMRDNRLAVRTTARILRMTVSDIHKASGCRDEENCTGPRCNIGGPQ